MNKLITLFICLYAHFSHAQFAEEFALYLGDGIGLTEGFNAFETTDGGHLLVGTQTQTTIENFNEPWVVKFDSEQNIEWEFLMDFAGTGIYDFAFDAIELDDGFVVLGNYSPPSFTSQSFVLKLDFQGEVSWVKTFDDYEISDYGAIHETENGTFVLGGYRAETIGPVNLSLTEYNGEGDEIWYKEYSDLSSGVGFPFYNALEILETGDIVFTSELNGEAVVLRTDSDGNLKWSQLLGTTGGGASVNQLEDGSLLVLTTRNFTSNPSVDELVQLDENGNILNVATLDFSVVEATTDCVVSSTGNIYVIGNDFTNDFGMILKVNIEGEIEWSHKISAIDSLDLRGLAFHGGSLNEENELIVAGSGLIDFSGNIFTTGYMYMAKFQLEEEVVSNIPDLNYSVTEFDVFPIPSVSSVHFVSEKNELEGGIIKLYDNHGKLVRQEIFNGNRTEIHKKNLTRGNYNYTISSFNGRKMDSGKIIFQ